MAGIDLNLLMNSLTYASIISLLSLGITLSYMTTRVFNFAHTRFATFAAYMAATTILYIVAASGIQPSFTTIDLGWGQLTVPLPGWVYLVGLIVAMIAGGFVAVLQYFAVLRPLEKRGAGSLTLMISTLGFDFILLAFLFVYSTHASVRGLAEAASRLGLSTSPDRLTMSAYDLSLVSGNTYYSGAFIEAMIFTLALVALFGIMLKKTKIGIMMRASIENPPLARVLGINVGAVYAFTWFLAGASAGIAGYLILFSTDTILSVYITPVSPSDNIIVSVFAGSIVGGIYSVFGSIGGGFLIGLVEQLFVTWLSTALSFPELYRYAKVFSMAAVAITLLFLPEGIASLPNTRWWRKLFGRKEEGGV